MRSSPTSRRGFLAVGAGSVAAAVLAGCGSSDGGSSSTAAPPPGAAPGAGGGAPAAAAADTGPIPYLARPPMGPPLNAVLADAPSEDTVLLPGAVAFEPGEVRFPFGLVDVGQDPIEGAEVRVYVAKDLKGPSRGPIPAVFRELGPEGMAMAMKPGDVHSIYVSRLSIPTAGPWYLAADVTRTDGARSIGTTTLLVKKSLGVPDSGQRCLATRNPTLADGASPESLCTRKPVCGMHDARIADEIGRRPMVIAFATPALCSSRVCGPNVDSLESLRGAYGDRVAFVHSEVYKDNDPQKGVNAAMAQWRLQTEPWTYLIGADGRIADVLEGAVTVGEFRERIDALLA